MDKCLFNGEIVYAFEIAKSYDKETNIRKQGRLRTMSCVDSDCQQPVIYRHGDYKIAHFAHLKTDYGCPYDSYYRKTSGVQKKLKIAIFEQLKSKGYNVDLDVKVIPKHYSPILITLENGKRNAIEFTGKTITAKKLEDLKKAYNDIGISVDWIIVDTVNSIKNEKDACLIKRFQLNESDKQTAIIFNKETSEFEAVTFDKTEYQYNKINDPELSENNIFTLMFRIENLIIKDGCLAVIGFQEKFDEWVEDRKKYHEQKIQESKAHAEHWILAERQRQANKKYNLKREQESRNEHLSPLTQTKRKQDEPFCLANITSHRTQKPIKYKIFNVFNSDDFSKYLQRTLNDDVDAIRTLIGKVYECEDDELALFLCLYYEARAKESSPERTKYVEVCEHILRQAKRI